MALPQHVKKLATDAVAGKETTDWIRRHRGNTSGPFAGPLENDNSEEARQRALELVARSETMKQIRLVSANEVEPPLETPKHDDLHFSRSARMEYLWKGHVSEATKDGMERDYGR